MSESDVRHNWRLLQRFTTKSPLSHIGETQSTQSFLVEEPILQPDQTVESVFCYSGNAWRGQLRDLIADYFLNAVGSPIVNLDAFQLLYSGGSIGGNQQTDIRQARAYRRLITPLALLGGGVGNQILPGKLRVANAYPRCQETAHLIPDWPDGRGPLPSYGELTFDKEFSHKDDEKDPRKAARMELPAPETEQMTMLDDPEPKTKKSNKPPTQMRYCSELLIAGAQLLSHIDLLDASEVELGCLVSGIDGFSVSPHIGGQGNKGHGLVSLETRLVDLDTGEIVEPFLTVDASLILSPFARQAEDAYGRHCQDIYRALVESREAEIVKMIGAVA